MHTYYQDPAAEAKQMGRRNVFFTSAVAAGITGGALAAAGVASAATIGLGAFAATKLLGGKKQSSTPSSGPAAATPSYDRAAALAQGEADDKRRAIARNSLELKAHVVISQ
jgi:hypothetical protein